MPEDYHFTFRNSADGSQDWKIQGLEEFKLESNQPYNVTMYLTTDSSLGVAISTVAEPFRFAAGTLKYNRRAGEDQVWTFETSVPNEFDFKYNHEQRNIDLNCSLKVEQLKD